MKQLTENLIQLGNHYSNSFLVGKKEAIIIECGVTGSVTSLKPQWLQLEGKPEIKYLAAMHAHFDHVCGIPSLRKMFPRAFVLSGEQAQKSLANPKIVDNFFYQDDKMSEVMVNRGILEKKPESPKISNISVDQVISEGDKIELFNGLKLEALAAPGHSPCSMAFWMPEDHVMFLSDACGFQISDRDIFPLFFQGYDMYIQTIERLRGFPARILGIPHGEIRLNDEVGTFYQRSLDAAEKAFNDIKKMLDDGMAEDMMKKELFSRYYQKDLLIYTPENINLCVEILIKRVKECL